MSIGVASVHCANGLFLCEELVVNADGLGTWAVLLLLLASDRLELEAQAEVEQIEEAVQHGGVLEVERPVRRDEGDDGRRHVRRRRQKMAVDDDVELGGDVRRAAAAVRRHHQDERLLQALLFLQPAHVLLQRPLSLQLILDTPLAIACLTRD